MSAASQLTTTPLTDAPFGASWHSDWSFQQMPPAATLLHAKVVPPIGGDTLYASGTWLSRP
jgi:alpha-ketoglutarate-dependent taurine dioxygenase